MFVSKLNQVQCYHTLASCRKRGLLADPAGQKQSRIHPLPRTSGCQGAPKLSSLQPVAVSHSAKPSHNVTCPATSAGWESQLLGHTTSFALARTAPTYAAPPTPLLLLTQLHSHPYYIPESLKRKNRNCERTPLPPPSNPQTPPAAAAAVQRALQPPSRSHPPRRHVHHSQRWV